MEGTHKFRVVAWWSAERTGIAKSDSAPNAIQFTAPAAFGGLEGRWTPEDLLLGSIASCFTTTFQAIAADSHLDYMDLGVEVEGTVKKITSGYAFQNILIRPTLTIAAEEARQQAADVLKKVESLCLVSRAVATAQEFDPKIVLAKLDGAYEPFTSGRASLGRDRKLVLQGDGAK